MLASYGAGIAVNGSLLLQIFWYGVAVEGRSVLSLLAADFADDSSAKSDFVDVTDDEDDYRKVSKSTKFGKPIPSIE